jgi:hypothetical protein
MTQSLLDAPAAAGLSCLRTLPRHVISDIDLNKAAVVSKFQSDLGSIAMNLIRAYQLRFTQVVGNLSSPLLRWLNFTMRYVDRRPRLVALSDALSPEGLIVHDRFSDLGFLLPRADDREPANDLERLHSFVLPRWAIPVP